MTTFSTKIKQLIHSGSHCFGFDIIRYHKSPEQTLLGLKRWHIGTIIDVGANQGQFAQKVSSIFPRAQIYCFEPLDEPFQVLSSWAETQAGRVHCSQVALGESEDTVEMHLHVEHTPSSSLLASTDTCHELYPQTLAEKIITVPMMTLDHALKEHWASMERDILLKLDVQGFEEHVLRGSSATLSICRAVILEVSLKPLYSGQADFRILMNLLYDAGFAYAGNLEQIYASDGSVVYLDALFTKA